jgi:hypothetical protein
MDVISRLLVNYISEKYGKPDMVILEGHSMGGHISLLIAENYPEICHGVFGVGAALRDKGEEIAIPLTGNCLIPYIFVTNVPEIGPIRRYVETSGDSQVKPALWYVLRSGHCNISWEERKLTLDSLVQWIQGGEVEAEREMTYPTYVRESKLTYTDSNDHEKGASSFVRYIDVYGDIKLDFQEHELGNMRITPRSKIEIVVGDQSFEGYFSECGESFDVTIPEDALMLWCHADGYSMLCKNMTSWTKHTSAAQFLNISLGMNLHIKHVPHIQPKKLAIPSIFS